MSGRRALSLTIIGVLLGMLFLLQLPQIHTHPSTPVEPSRCPMVLVNSNTTGLSVTPLITLVPPITVTEQIPFDLPIVSPSQFLPSTISLRAPPAA